MGGIRSGREEGVMSEGEKEAAGLMDAASVLDDLAAGRAPDRARLLAGALALDTVRRSGIADRDMHDAAAGLEAIATRGSLDLDEKGRARAAVLADAVRALATALQGKVL
jgi:chloramphenicol 3-O-phosphotransferase